MLLAAAILLAACGDDTTTADEVGESSTESGSDSSDSGSTESSDSSDSSSTETDSSSTETTETTGGGVCNADDVEDIDISLGLVGSQAPANGCSDYVFTGTLEGGGNGNWNLDACPCGALCLIPDPYTLSIITPDLGMLPSVPTCPKIEMRRNADCEVVSIVISDLLQAEMPVWIGSREPTDPGTVPELEVNANLFGVCECVDCNPPTLYELQVDWDGESIVVAEGTADIVGGWTAYAISSHTYEVGDVDWFAWVMKR